MFEMKPLPYAIDALEPFMPQTTMEFHYGKHYKTYVDNLNKLIKGTEFESMSLVEIIQKTYGNPEFQGIFNNAGQVFNLEFFWNSMSPLGGGEHKGKLSDMIKRDFGSYDKFKEELKNAAVTQFGSGWAWVVENNGKLEIMKTANADTPIARGIKPLINIDVWEHAYYLDFQNRRPDYVENFLNNLVNWPETAV